MGDAEDPTSGAAPAAVAPRPVLREPWHQIRSTFAAEVRARFSGWIAPDQPHFETQLAFALSRLEDGIGRTIDWYRSRLPDYL